MRTTIKVPNIVDFFSQYPSIEKKKNKIIVRIKRYSFYRGQNFLEVGYVYAPYIPIDFVNISFEITKNKNDNRLL